MTISIENLRNVFSEEVDDNLDLNELGADEKFDDFGIDSLDRSSAFLAVEDKFGIEIPDTDIEKVQTLNQLKHYLEAKTA